MLETRKSCVLLLALAALAIPTAAEERVASDRRRDGEPSPWMFWQLKEENDFLSGEDDAYTQGLLLTLGRDPDLNPSWAERLGERLWQGLYPRRAHSLDLAFEIGQSIFTPEDLAPRELIPDDRPYAGYLYGGVILTLTENVLENPIQQLFELQVGIVGPASGAEEAQSGLHEIIGSQEPMGWDNQLPSEPIVNLIYLWRRKIGSARADFVPHWGGALGNLQIFANAGFTLRFGKDLPGFPNRIIRSTRVRERKTWDAHVFVGVDGRAVARNLFVDGSTFRDSHSVEREDLVADLKAGFSVRYNRLRFNYTWVRRSREFELPAGREGGGHEFGSFSFTWDRSY